MRQILLLVGIYFLMRLVMRMRVHEEQELEVRAVLCHTASLSSQEPPGKKTALKSDAGPIRAFTLPLQGVDMHCHSEARPLPHVLRSLQSLQSLLESQSEALSG
jgi:hypothetical protein